MNERLRKIVTSAAFTALICVGTMIIQIPMPFTNGYVNLGDGFIIIGVWLLGMPWGAAAAAIGSALADLLTGYAIYAPATFLIKGLMALCAFAVFGFFSKKHSLIYFGRTLSAISAELVMMLGYTVYSVILLSGNIYGALASLPGNLIQGAFGVIIALVIMIPLEKTGVVRRLKLQ